MENSIDSILDSLSTVAQSQNVAGAQGSFDVIEDMIEGELISYRTFSGNWSLGEIRDGAGKSVTIAGELSNLEPGANYQFFGKFFDHSKWGRRFNVTRTQVDTSSDQALEGYLQKHFGGVGPSLAKKLIKYHASNGTLDSLRDDLIYNPLSVDFGAVTDAPVRLINNEQSVIRRIENALQIRLGATGLNADQMRKFSTHLKIMAYEKRSDILKLHGVEEIYQAPEQVQQEADIVRLALQALAEDPYEPIAHIDGYGFKRADAVAKKLGIDENSELRLKNLAAYALLDSCTDIGHSYLTQDMYKQAINKYDNKIDASELINKNYPKVVAEKTASGDYRYYAKSIFTAEKELAENLANRLKEDVPALAGQASAAQISEAISAAEAQISIKNGAPFVLDDTQRAAVEGILTSTKSVHTITGGPGCGKTALLESVMYALKHLRSEFLTDFHGGNALFCAPVGKAAKVMSNRVGNWGQARTIHSLLKYKGQGINGYKFEINSASRLEAPIVVVDESSMIDVQLGAGLFNGIAPRAHVIMLGDPDQLTPIAPGSVFLSVLRLPFDHHKLYVTHRNDGDLLKVINKVGKGQSPEQDVEGVSFTNQMPEPSDQELLGLLNEIRQSVEQYGGLSHVGVLCPVRRGKRDEPGWNVTYLNQFLRDNLNGHNSQIMGSIFNVRDRIILKKNMNLLEQYDSRLEKEDFSPSEDEAIAVVNGDTGYITSAHIERKGAISEVKGFNLHLDSGANVFLLASDAKLMDWAYAITVHAAQGSEYEKVIAIMPKGRSDFMHRSMAFTAYSRAKKELHVIGDAFERSKIIARLAPKRNCVLANRAAHYGSVELLPGHVQAVVPTPQRNSAKSAGALDSLMALTKTVSINQESANDGHEQQSHFSRARMR